MLKNGTPTERPAQLTASPLEGAATEWRLGRLASRKFDDIYSGRDQPDIEALEVYLNGCGLPEQWGNATKALSASQRYLYVLAETGFGAGVNILTAASTWRDQTQTSTRPKCLHLISVEGFPLDQETLAACRDGLDGLQIKAEAEKLLNAWPIKRLPDGSWTGLTPSFERVWLSESVCLTLIFGLADIALSSLLVPSGVNAWLLDGFTPSRNPEIWSGRVMAEIGRLSAVDACAASFTVARSVRDGLASAGFDVERRRSLKREGKKSETLAARRKHPASVPLASAMSRDPLPPWFAPPTPHVENTFQRIHPVTVVGAGLAGTCLVLALLRRGVAVKWLFDPATPAVSDLPHALITPKVGRTATPVLTFYAQCLRYALRFYAEFAPGQVHQHGTWKVLSKDTEQQSETTLQTLRAIGLGAERVDHMLHLHEGASCSGQGLLSALRSVCRDLGATPEPYPLKPENFIKNLTEDSQAEDGPIVLCCGAGLAPLLPDLPFRLYDGELCEVQNRVSPSSQNSDHNRRDKAQPIITKGAYLTGWSCHEVCETAWLGGGGRLAKELIAPLQAGKPVSLPPDLSPNMESPSIEATGQRWSGQRTALPDRLPIAGPLPKIDAFCNDYAPLLHNARIDNQIDLPPPRYLTGHYVLGGLGARGFLTAPLLAEYVASLILDEPWPLSAEQAALILPARFLIRALKTGQIKI